MRLRKYLCRSLLLWSSVLSFVLSGCDGDNGAGSGGGGGSYASVKIGDMVWMKKNLNIKTEDSWCYGEGGQVYDDVNGGYKTLSSSEIQANCNKYGRLYTWAAAKTACPNGWKLPTRAEWGALAKVAGGTGNGTAGTKLKSKRGWNGTDDFGFSALPGGFRYYYGDFEGAGNSGYWWTATESDIGTSYDRTMYNGSGMEERTDRRSFGYSVRCVKDYGDKIVKGSFTYGGQTYGTVKIGDQTWMAENLNVTTENSSCYDSSAAKCMQYGRLYTWEAANKACQLIGWKLPDTADWRRLSAAAGGGIDATVKLKAESGWPDGSNGTDDYGFSILPGGYFVGLTNIRFNNAGLQGDYWTSVAAGSQTAFYILFGKNNSGIYPSSDGQDVGMSVRCVQE